MPDTPFGGDNYTIYYYGFCRPSFREFQKNPNSTYRVEVIDTWEMTLRDCGIYSGNFRIDLPGKEYMAIRIIKIN
ncbi:MAG: DUF5605 domain-containing protein [Oscillospiraceae bacterium]